MLAARVLRAADRLWQAYAVTFTRKVKRSQGKEKRGAEAAVAPTPALAMPAGQRRTLRA